MAAWIQRPAGSLNRRAAEAGSRRRHLSECLSFVVCDPDIDAPMIHGWRLDPSLCRRSRMLVGLARSLSLAASCAEHQAERINDGHRFFSAGQHLLWPLLCVALATLNSAVVSMALPIHNNRSSGCQRRVGCWRNTKAGWMGHRWE